MQLQRTAIIHYGDYTGLARAVDVQAYSFYHNFVGNVLGMNGQTLLDGAIAQLL